MIRKPKAPKDTKEIKKRHEIKEMKDETVKLLSTSQCLTVLENASLIY